MPVTVWFVNSKPLAFWRVSARSVHIGGKAGFIENYQAFWLFSGDKPMPCFSCFGNIRPLLLSRENRMRFPQGKTASFFAVALCVAPFFRFRSSPYGAIPEAGTRLPSMQHLGLDCHAMRCLRLGGMCQV